MRRAEICSPEKEGSCATSLGTQAQPDEECGILCWYPINEEREQARTIVFKKLALDIMDGPPRQIVGYICDDNFVDGYQLIQFNPACLYLSYKNTSNFKLLASKMCVNRNHLIVAKKST